VDEVDDPPPVLESSLVSLSVSRASLVWRGWQLAAVVPALMWGGKVAQRDRHNSRGLMSKFKRDVISIIKLFLRRNGLEKRKRR